ncbi:MAG TPA: AAA family ATPase [Ktedonobacterales bacterium]|nr:AAA family ATPase [Ktedonobacterales bacterium]
MIQWPFASNPPPQRPASSPAPLVGREREMELLRHSLKAIFTGSDHFAPTTPRAVLVAGAAGLGKTRLLRELAAEAESSNAIVLWGGAYESGLLPPYLPFTEALRPYLRSLTPERLSRLLGLTSANESSSQSLVMPHIGLQSLAQLFPQIAALPGLPALQEPLTPDQEKFGLLDGFATLLERMAEARKDTAPKSHPILLCLDDLQWADSASLELLLYLTTRLRSANILLVGALRNGFIDPSVGSALGRAIAELNRQRLFTLLLLNPLSEGSSSVLLDSLLPGGIAPDLRQAILARAEGNPFFIEELVHALQGSGQIVAHDGLWQRARGSQSTLSGPLPELPPSIKMTLALRLEPLSAPCRDLLRAAALCGPAFYPDVLAAATGQSQETVLDLLDEASEAGLIEIVPDEESENAAGALDAYRFAQRIARELLAGQLPRPSRRRLHAALASALQARSRTRQAAERNAAEIAHHFTQAGRTHQAIHWTILAGDVADGRHAQREAIGFYRSALALLDTSAGAPAAEGADEAAPEPPATSDPLSQEPAQTYRPGQVHRRLAESWFRLGEFQSALRSFQAALDEERPIGDTLSLAQLNRLISDAYRQLGQYDQAFGYLQAAQTTLASLESAPSTDNTLTEQMLQRQSLAVLMIGAGQGEAAESALRESQQLAIQIGDRSGQAFALHMLGWLKGWGEQIAQAIQLQVQARDLLLELGDPYHAAIGYEGLGIVYQAIGDSANALKETEAGLALATRFGITRSIPWLRYNLGVLALAQGRWSDATDALEEARAESERANDARLKPILRQALGILAWRLGNLEQAQQAFEDGYQAAQISFEWLPGSAGLLGWFLARTSHPEAARPYLDQATMRSFFNPVGFAADFYLPFVAEGLLCCGDLEAAARLAERFKPWAERQYYGISAQRILGRIAAAQEHWTDARRAFAAALEFCHRAGSQPEQVNILLAWAEAALAQARSQPAQASALVDDIERFTEEAERLSSALGLSAQTEQAIALRAEAAHMQQQTAAALPGAPAIDPNILKGLTPRELEVLRLVADGKTDKEIAEVLVISPRTANRHIANIFLKIDVTSRAAAAAYAIRNRLV